MKKGKNKNLIALFLFMIFLGTEFLIYFNNKQKYLRYKNFLNIDTNINTNISVKVNSNKNKQILDNEINEHKININESIQYENLKEAEKILNIIKNEKDLTKKLKENEIIEKAENIEISETKLNIKKVGQKTDLTKTRNEIDFIEDEENQQFELTEKTEETKELDKWIKKSDYIFTESIKDKLIENDTNDYVKKIKNLVDEARQGEVLYDYNMEQEIKENLDKIYLYGDSNVKHFEYYNMLSYKYYGFLVSRIENQEKEIEKHIKKRNPKKIVFFNGYNIAYYKNGEEYVEQYKKIIQKIKSIDPKIKIYICSLLPAQEFKKVEDLHQDFPHNIYRGEEFDKALEDYFTEDEKGATYINTKWIIKEDYYGKDGVHMKKPFYKVLVRYIAYLLQII